MREGRVERTGAVDLISRVKGSAGVVEGRNDLGVSSVVVLGLAALGLIGVVAGWITTKERDASDASARVPRNVPNNTDL